MSPLRKPCWLVVAVLVTCVGACTPRVPPSEAEELPPPPTAPVEDLKALADGNNTFAIDLYKKLAEKEAGNILFSPYSIRTALGMTYAGARSETAEEMRKTLHFTLPDEKLHPAFGATAHQLKGGKDGQYELNVANSLWGQKGFTIQPEFLELTKKNYTAGFRELDFVADPNAAREAINHWVEEQTKDRIKELLKRGSVTQRTRLVLVNALYFKGQWEKPFDARQTTDAQFHVAANRTAPVRMMVLSGEFYYAETDDVQLVYLPYRSDREARLSMVVILPKAVDGLPKVESQLSSAQFQKWLTAGYNNPGTVLLPQFSSESEYALAPQLTGLGMKKLFGAADLSGITPDGGFFVRDVIHKAVIEVNEEGTVAATAVVGETTVTDRLPRKPFLFRADHPFLYAIVAQPTGTVLFLGRFTGPR